MKKLIIYDSYFGNTQTIAEGIAQSISGAKAIKLDKINQKELNDLEVLIVGSPTRAFRPTKNISDFIAKLQKDQLKNVKVGAFDTGINKEDTKSGFLKFMIGVFGYASTQINKALISKGGNSVTDPISFWVLDTKGPLKQGELKRAKQWADKINNIAD